MPTELPTRKVRRGGLIRHLIFFALVIPCLPVIGLAIVLTKLLQWICPDDLYW